MTITSLPSGSFFLENIPDIDILTAKTRLLVTIKIGDDIIYDEYLYPADGEIRVSDLADIFRPYARRRLAVSATITIAEQQVPDSGDTDLVFVFVLSFFLSILNHLLFRVYVSFVLPCMSHIFSLAKEFLFSKAVTALDRKHTVSVCVLPF